MAGKGERKGEKWERENSRCIEKRRETRIEAE